MGKKILLLLLGLMVVLTGCKNETVAETMEKKIECEIECASNVREADCCICGSNNRSMMDYYRKSGMVGLVCLDTMNISTLDTRIYSNDGTEIIDSSSGMMYTSHGEGECSFSISGMPDRGIMEASVYYGEAEDADFDKISEFLCQSCLDKVEAMYVDEMELSDGDGRFPEVCLVDFATDELYTLGEHCIGYWIRDFWVHIDHKEDQSDIMVIYAPEGNMEGYKYVGDRIKEKNE